MAGRWSRHRCRALFKWQMRGLVDAQAEASLASPSLVIRTGKGRLDAHGAAIDATARANGGAMSVTVRRASLESPAIAVTGSFAWSEANGYQVEAQTGDVDIPALQTAARNAAPDVEWLAHPPVRLDAGTIRSLQFSSRALALDQLGQPDSMDAQAEIAGVELVVPAYDLHLHEVTATATLKGRRTARGTGRGTAGEIEGTRWLVRDDDWA